MGGRKKNLNDKEVEMLKMLSEAEKFLGRKVREKTNPEGKRERKYKIE